MICDRRTGQSAIRDATSRPSAPATPYTALALKSHDRWRQERYRSPEAWREDLEKHILIVETKPTKDVPFEAHMANRNFGSATILRTSQSPQSYIRSKAMVARDNCRDPIVCLVERGVINLEQYGRKVTVKSGDCLLYDPGSPYLCECPETVDTLHVRIPYNTLERALGPIEDAAVRLFDGRQGWGSVLASYVRSMCDDELPTPFGKTVMLDQLMSLLTLAATPWVASSDGRVSSMARQILNAIRERCSDEMLCAADVAIQLNMSRRTLDRALAAYGTTFCTALEEARLKVAYDLMRTPGGSQLLIGQVVDACGFTSAAHFARKFRMVYGMSPSGFQKSAEQAEVSLSD